MAPHGHSPAGDPARSVRSRSNRRQDRRGALLYGWPAILTGTLDPLTSVLGACLIVRPTPHFFGRFGQWETLRHSFWPEPTYMNQGKSPRAAVFRPPGRCVDKGVGLKGA